MPQKRSMNTKRPYEKLFCYLFVPLAFFMLQACDGVSGPTSKEPLVIKFDFETPVQATVAQKLKFLEALNKYSAPGSAKIVVDGHQIYPFLPNEGATLKTESVVSARDNGEGATGATVNTRTSNNEGYIKVTRGNPAMIVNTRNSDNSASGSARITRAIRDTHFVKDTRTQEWIASAAKTRSSQYVAFKNQQDMKAFLRAIEVR